MAYPYQISSSAFLSDPFFTPGPYYYGGNRFVVLQSHPSGTSSDQIHVYMSSDLGQTWSEQHAASAPLFYQSNTSSPIDTYYNASSCGSKLRITYVPQGGSPGSTGVNIIEFDMANPTAGWGTPLTGGPAPGDDQRFKTVLLSDGTTYRTVFMDLGGGTRWHINVATYAGSWSAKTVLMDPGVSESTTLDYFLAGVQLDSDDNIGVLAACNSSLGSMLRYIRYSSAGATGTFIRTPHFVAMTVGAGPISRTGTSSVFPLSSGDEIFAYASFGFITSGNGFKSPTCIQVDPGASPVGNRVDSVNAEQLTASPGSTPFANVLYDASQKALLLYWSHFDGTSQFKIRRAESKVVGGWASLTDVFVPANTVHDSIQAIAAQIVNSNRVGIAFSCWADNAVVAPDGFPYTYQFPFYYEEDVPTVTAVGCPGGSGNINAARH